MWMPNGRDAAGATVWTEHPTMSFSALYAAGRARKYPSIIVRQAEEQDGRGWARQNSGEWPHLEDNTINTYFAKSL